MEPRTGKTIDFILEAEEEVIREAVTHKLDRPLFITPNKIWRDSNQTKAPTPDFQVCDSLRYTNEGHNEMVELVDVNKNYPDIIMYIIN